MMSQDDSPPAEIKHYGAIAPYTYQPTRRGPEEDFPEPTDEEPVAPDWEFYGQRGQAHRAGQWLADLGQDLASIEYSPPEWPVKALVTELRLMRQHMSRQARQAQRSARASLLAANTYSLAIAALTLGLCNLYVTLAPTFNLPLGPYAGRGFLGTTDVIYMRKIQVGDRIAGYEVTSGFGTRADPISGATSVHKGVDIPTPVGTAVYGPGTGGTVECLEDPGGYGSYAVVQAEGLPYEFIYGHLSKCQGGSYKPGDVVALTGNSGKSTGAHLHFEMRQDGEAIAPTTGYALWALQGNPPKPHGIDPARGGFGGVADFAERIKAQESSGRVGIVNEIGAAGLYQFMPDTLAAVAPDCVGRAVTQEEFLADPNLQSQIAQCYWAPAMKRIQQSTSDPILQCRQLAAYHYAGNEALSESTSPQGYAPDGSPYPSVAEYADKICGGAF